MWDNISVATKEKETPNAQQCRLNAVFGHWTSPLISIACGNNVLTFLNRLTNRWSQPLAAVKSTFDFMKQFPMVCHARSRQRRLSLFSLDGMVATAVQKFSIAPATVDDCRQCAALLVGQLSEHVVDASAEQLAQVLENVVADPRGGYLLLARESSRIIGVAYVATILSAEHCGLVGWLEELYVLPEHRSRGVGTALLTAILERACAIGVVAMDLEIDASHSRVESLYRRFGFQPLERSRWVRKLTT